MYKKYVHATKYKLTSSIFPEAVTPVVLEAQKQFNFSHIVAGASAFGRVSYSELINCPGMRLNREQS